MQYLFIEHNLAFAVGHVFGQASRVAVVVEYLSRVCGLGFALYPGKGVATIHAGKGRVAEGKIVHGYTPMWTAICPR